MEINVDNFTSTMATLDCVKDNAGTSYASETTDSAFSADDATRMLFSAVRDLQQAQARRREAHAQAVGNVACMQNRGGAPILDSLLDSLDGVALSEYIDAPREEEAGRRIRKMLHEDGQKKVDLGEPQENSANDFPFDQRHGSGDVGVGNLSENLHEVWEQMAEMIEEYKVGDLKLYADTLQMYTKVYQDLSNILSQFGNWVKSHGDTHMEVNFDAIKAALNTLVTNIDTKYVIAKDIKNKEDADAICDKLGIDPKCAIQQNDGTYIVVPDKAQISEMISGITKDGTNCKISIAAYNAWKAGFDAQMSRVEDALQVRGQKYSNAYGRFENFHKTMSSIIQSMADMLRQFLRF